MNVQKLRRRLRGTFSRLGLVVLVVAVLTFVTVPHLLAQAKSADCIAKQYDVVALPLRPAHINESGQVAGTASHHRAGTWSAKKGLQELPLPPGFYNSEAAGLNSSDNLAGTAYDQMFTKHRAFMVFGEKLTLLEGEQSVEHWINDSGEVAGEMLIRGKATTGPVLWTEKATIPLGGCCGGAATGVNSHGQVVGDIYDEAGSYHAFR
jgi:hypothetical protein